jgi:hypothetical protein
MKILVCPQQKSPFVISGIFGHNEPVVPNTSERDSEKGSRHQTCTWVCTYVHTYEQTQLF